jgi:hypothetical protein
MTLAIDIELVSMVLLDGAWFEVAGHSFGIDAYEYVGNARERSPEQGAEPDLLHVAGDSGISVSGFTFQTAHGDHLSGPLTAITAVRHSRRSRP